MTKVWHIGAFYWLPHADALGSRNRCVLWQVFRANWYVCHVWRGLALSSVRAPQSRRARRRTWLGILIAVRVTVALTVHGAAKFDIFSRDDPNCGGLPALPSQLIPSAILSSCVNLAKSGWHCSLSCVCVPEAAWICGSPQEFKKIKLSKPREGDLLSVPLLF